MSPLLYQHQFTATRRAICSLGGFCPYCCTCSEWRMFLRKVVTPTVCIWCLRIMCGGLAWSAVGRSFENKLHSVIRWRAVCTAFLGHLGPWTMHNYWALARCTIIGPLHDAQLLAHVSNITSPGNAAYQSNFKLGAHTWVRQANHPDGMSPV